MSDTFLSLDSCLGAVLRCASPSGYELPAGVMWRSWAKQVTNDVWVDAFGNSFARVTGTDGSRAESVMLFGHMDEIGVIITHIDERGLCWIGTIGGWDPQVLVGQRVVFRNSRGEDVHGVVGRKPIHLIEPNEREKAAKVKELWVDIGASDRATAQAHVRIGDAGVIAAAPALFLGDRLVARGLDNRIGAVIVLEALRLYAAAPGARTVIAAATVQEEISGKGGGAQVAAARMLPDWAVVIDVTHASDVPGIDTRVVGDHALGSGPAIARGSVVNPFVFDRLENAAVNAAIPHTFRAVGSGSSTDADNVQVAGSGVPTGLIGLPNRYMHSPNEMVAMSDVRACAQLLCEAMQGE